MINDLGCGVVRRRKLIRNLERWWLALNRVVGGTITSRVWIRRPGTGRSGPKFTFRLTFSRMLDPLDRWKVYLTPPERNGFYGIYGSVVSWQTEFKIELERKL
jgi:hypothetical protein